MKVTGLDLVIVMVLIISDLPCLQPVTPGARLPVTTDLLRCIENPPLR